MGREYGLSIRNGNLIKDKRNDTFAAIFPKNYEGSGKAFAVTFSGDKNGKTNLDKKPIAVLKPNGSDGTYEAVDKKYENDAFFQKHKQMYPERYRGSETFLDEKGNVYIKMNGNIQPLIGQAEMHFVLDRYNVVFLDENGYQSAKRLLTKVEYESLRKYDPNEFTIYVTPKGITGIKEDIGADKAPTQGEMQTLLKQIQTANKRNQTADMVKLMEGLARLSKDEVDIALDKVSNRVSKKAKEEVKKKYTENKAKEVTGKSMRSATSLYETSIEEGEIIEGYKKLLKDGSAEKAAKIISKYKGIDLTEEKNIEKVRGELGKEIRKTLGIYSTEIEDEIYGALFDKTSDERKRSGAGIARAVNTKKRKMQDETLQGLEKAGIHIL